MRANDRQEGGDHYRQAGTDIPQHWDLSVMFDWDPFQYQITKYVMRWKDKHASFEKRLEDLNKARHFIDKYIEEARRYDDTHQLLKKPATEVILMPVSKRVGKDMDVEWAMQEAAAQQFQPDGFFSDGTQGYQCIHCREVVRAGSPLTAQYGHTCSAMPQPGI